MKAGIHIALFLTTLYDYFYPPKKSDDLEEPQPDNPHHADIESDCRDELIPYNGNTAEGYKRYRSHSQARRGSSLFDFEDEEEVDKDV
jgi:hypothetical protein